MYQKSRTITKGFTLVELLVVIAIIGILIAMLLPAVQAARGAARRLQNANHLKQIGLATIQYAEQYGNYPYLRISARGTGYHTAAYSNSWAFAILPFMEQSEIHDQYDPLLPCWHPSNATAMRTPVSTFYNPDYGAPEADHIFDNGGVSVPGLAGEKIAAGGDYAANRGWHDYSNSNFDNNNPCCEPFRAAYSGPFSIVVSRLSSEKDLVKPAMVTDGLSHTLLVGDKWEHEDSTRWAFFSGDMPIEFQRGAEGGFPVGFDDTSSYKFGSPSGNQAAFVFADGHVTSINYAIEFEVYRSLAAVGDGQAIDTEDLN